MKIQLILANLVLLTSCRAALPAPVDTVLSTTPGVGAVAGAVVPQLGLSRSVTVMDEPGLIEAGYLGMTRNFADTYLITLEPSLSDREKVMVLIHELAHVVVMDRGLEQTDPHGVAWGEAYSEVYLDWMR